MNNAKRRYSLGSAVHSSKQEWAVGLTVVDTDDGADHLGHDDHVAKVGLDTLGLLAGRRV